MKDGKGGGTMNGIVSRGELNGSGGEVWPEGVLNSADGGSEKDEAATGRGIWLRGEAGEQGRLDGGAGGVVEGTPVNGKCTAENDGGEVTQNGGRGGAEEMRKGSYAGGLGKEVIEGGLCLTDLIGVRCGELREDGGNGLGSWWCCGWLG